MTKEEVLTALAEGKTVTHSTFSPIERMRQLGHFYEFEDGSRYPPAEFWRWRTDDVWQDNWICVDEVAETVRPATPHRGAR